MGKFTKILRFAWALCFIVALNLTGITVALATSIPGAPSVDIPPVAKIPPVITQEREHGFIPALEPNVVIKTRGKNFRIIDGDTFDAEFRKVKNGIIAKRRFKSRFRLCGINAPERSAFHYAKSTNMLRKIISAHKNLIGIVVGRGSYKRQIVILYPPSNKGPSVNESMVEYGGAKHFRRYSTNCTPAIDTDDLDALEAKAKARNIGMWSQ